MARSARDSGSARRDRHAAGRDRPNLSLSAILAIGPNETAETLEATLEGLAGSERRGVTLDIILIGPRTPPIELPEGARFIPCEDGPAACLLTAARAARGSWLLFLTPGVRLDRGWDASVMVFTSDERNRERAAVFTFTLDRASAETAALERSVRFRNNWLGLPEAEQGLLISRRFYRHLEGHRPPDCLAHGDLARRIGMVRIARLDVRIVIPAGPLATRVRAPRNRLRLLLFALRLPARWTARLVPDRESG